MELNGSEVLWVVPVLLQTDELSPIELQITTADVANLGGAAGPTPTLNTSISQTLAETNLNVFATTTGGSIFLTLPTAADTQGLEYFIKKIDASVNTVSIVGTVDGSTSTVLSSRYEAITLKSNGLAYYITSYYPGRPVWYNPA